VPEPKPNRVFYIQFDQKLCILDMHTVVQLSIINQQLSYQKQCSNKF